MASAEHRRRVKAREARPLTIQPPVQASANPIPKTVGTFADVWCSSGGPDAETKESFAGCWLTVTVTGQLRRLPKADSTLRCQTLQRAWRRCTQKPTFAGFGSANGGSTRRENSATGMRLSTVGDK
jgi:hypothetical protein